MLIITYDISNNKLRTRFAKLLEKHGYRLQYSVFEIKNSTRILANLKVEIASDFEKQFGQDDSILIFDLSQQCKITRYGYAVNDNDELIII